MKKIREGLKATAYKVKAEALTREIKRQGVSLEKSGQFCSLERSGFGPDELVEVGGGIVAERDAYVSESTSSGAVSNAYRSGWDAVFGQGKPGAKA